MKPRIIPAIIICSSLISCNMFQGNKTYKFDSDNIKTFQQEYQSNQEATKSKYLNHTAELTGTINSEEGYGNFMFYQYNKDSSIAPAGFAKIDIQPATLKAQSIIGYILKANWYYNKQTNEFVNEKEFNQDVNGFTNGYGIHYFDMSDVLRIFDEVKNPGTYAVPYTEQKIDELLHRFIKDESLITAIKNNKVAYSDRKNLIVTDKITVCGKITNIDNGIQLSDAKIINDEKLLDINNLPVVDYATIKNILNKNAPKDTANVDNTAKQSATPVQTAPVQTSNSTTKQVTVDKAYFYQTADLTTKRKGFLIKGQSVTTSQEQGDFFLCTYSNNGKNTIGYMLKSDLQ